MLTVTYTGFVNKDNALKLTMMPNISTITITVSPIGEYPITASSAVTVNYIFAPNGDGINDIWDIKSLQDYPNCTVNIYN
jgi:hypothetical protein